MPVNFTVAFLGDQGVGTHARENLEMLAREGVELVIHQGDMGYSASPQDWDTQISNALGHNFPYISVAGNHDVRNWQFYRQLIGERLVRSGLSETCRGRVGESMTCAYKGFAWYMSDIGTFDNPHFSLPRELFRETPWKACGWHKNRHLLQAEHKKSQVPWYPYHQCAKEGALIFNGHTHTYSRTWVLSGLSSGDDINVEQKGELEGTEASPLLLSQGKTVVVISGLGGASVRDCVDPLIEKPWWASILCSNYPPDDPAPSAGSTICKFNLDGDANRALCTFIGLHGRERDRFSLQWVP